MAARGAAAGGRLPLLPCAAREIRAATLVHLGLFASSPVTSLRQAQGRPGLLHVKHPVRQRKMAPSTCSAVKAQLAPS